MDNVIHKSIEEIDGYLQSIQLDYDLGCYYIEMGIDSNWDFEDNERIKCSVIDEDEKNGKGKFIKISPRKKYVDSVKIDDLILFAKFIVKFNQELDKEQEEFENKLKKQKEEMTNKINSFYEELSKKKKETFTKLSDDHDDEPNNEIDDSDLDDKEEENTK